MGATRRRWVALMTMGVLLCGAQVASAGSVRLDRSFGGGDGHVETNFITGEDHAWGVAVQDDGRIVVAGIAVIEDHSFFVVLRYGRDGTLDHTWGGHGYVVTEFDKPNAAATGVAIDERGRVLVVGTAWGPDSSRIALARYGPKGALDTTFDRDGQMLLGLVGDDSDGRAIAVDSRGRIVVLGEANSSFGVIRLRPTGSLDRSFHHDGKAVVSVFGRGNPQALLVDRQDRVVLGGAAGWHPDQDARFAVIRLTEDGVRDPDFGGDGIVLTQFSPTYEVIGDMTLDAERRIVVAGGTGQAGGYGRFAMARYLPDGRLDDTFDGDGKATDDVSDKLDQAAGVVVRGDSIYVSGDVGVTSNGDAGDIGMFRYGPGGSRTGGERVNLSKDRDVATASAVQPGRGIIVVGGAFGMHTFSVLRFHA